MLRCARNDAVGVVIQTSTSRCTSAFSRHDLPEACISLSPSNEGAGNAGCALHPRSRVQTVRVKTHTSIQGSGEHPTFLRNGFTAYDALAPENLALLSPSPLRNLAGQPGRAFRTSARLDANPEAVRPTRLRRTLRHRSSARPKDRSRSLSRPAILFRARCRRVHRIPSQRSVTMANAPCSGTGWRDS